MMNSEDRLCLKKKVLRKMSPVCLAALILPQVGSAEIVYDDGTHSITANPAQQSSQNVFSLMTGAAVSWNGANYAQTNTDLQARGFVLSDSSSLTMNSGSVSISTVDNSNANSHANWIYADSGYSGTVTVNGGTYSVSSSGDGNAKFLRLNDPGTYTVNLAGGIVNINETGNDGDEARLVRMKGGTVNISGGTYNITDDLNSMVVFNQLTDPNALLDISGGTFNLDAGGEITLFRLENNAGELRISGGLFNANQKMTGLVRGGRVVLDGRFEGISPDVYNDDTWTDGPLLGILSDGSVLDVDTLIIEEGSSGQIEIISESTSLYFADNGQESPVAVLQHPSVAYYNGVTYVAYQGLSEDAYVAAYQHDTGMWTGPVLAGTSFLKDGDGHGKPTICVDDNGYIHVVFGGHGGHSSFGDNTAYSYEPTDRTLGNAGKQTHMRSDAPEDISSWSELENISPFGTYSQLIKMDDGDIYLFYRHGGHKSDWTWQRSTDNGLTFTGAARIMDAIEYGNGEGVEAWYMFFNKGPGDTVDVTYAYHPCMYENHVDERFNVYYMRFSCSDHKFRTVEGTVVGRPLTKATADANTMINNSEQYPTVLKNGSVNHDPAGNPWICYPRKNSQTLYTMKWTGSAWTSAKIAPDINGWQKGDLWVKTETVAKAVVGGSKDGRHGLSWYKTTDGGATWAQNSIICPFTDTFYSKRIGSFLSTGHPDAQFVVAEWLGSTETNMKLYLFGKAGFVPRYLSLCPEDGYLIESYAASGTGGGAVSDGAGKFGLRVGDTDSNCRIKALVSFDTSVIPDDAVITSATLRLKSDGSKGDSPFQWGGVCHVDISSGPFGADAVLEPGDFQAPADASQVAVMEDPSTAGGWSDGELSMTGLSKINKQGKTQFRISFNIGSNNNLNQDYVGFYAGDHAELANRPQLAVTYSTD